MSTKVNLTDFRTSVKEHICKTLTDIYLRLNYGQLPNWEDEEEVYVEADDIGLHLTTEVEVSNTYDDSRYKEDWEITAYVVTLDENLFFHCEDNELEWTEISTDELVGILEKLDNCLERRFPGL
jgi:hypothetical protein